MRKLLMTKQEAADEFDLTATDIQNAEEAGLLRSYDGPESNKWVKYHLHDLLALVRMRGEDLMKRTDVERDFGLTRHQIMEAVHQGKLKKYTGPLEKRYLQFRRSDVQAFVKEAGL